MANRDAGAGTNNGRSPDVAEPSTNLLRSPPLIPNLTAVEELFVDVLAAGLAYLLELLVVGPIRQILPAR